MTTGEFDTEDAPGFLAIALGAVSLTGIGTISVYSYSLGDTAFNLAGTAISYAALLVIIGTVWISVTNEVGLDDWTSLVSDKKDPQGRGQLETAYYASAIGLLVIPFAMEFVTSVNDFVVGSDFAGTAAALVLIAGAGVAAYGG